MKSSCSDVEAYLHEHIPLSAAMCVTVLGIDEEGVRLAAPIAPNINHRHTVFGGSVSAVAILSAWTLLYTRLTDLDIPARVVIQRSETDYDAPVTGDFEAFCPAPREGDWQRFLLILKRRNKARLRLNAEIFLNGKTVGRFAGEFVAVRTVADKPDTTDSRGQPSAFGTVQMLLPIMP